MKRRDFLKMTAATSLFASFPTLLKANNDYQGMLVVTVFARGGWDPTSFCDPKMNVAGERVINNWATTNSIQTVGNINYAPFADNDAFFRAHYQKMLVINGIDVKSNGHSTGTLNNMTGIMKDGYPSLAALFAASNKSQQLMPWLAGNSRPNSGKLLTPSTMASRSELERLKRLALTNRFRTGRTDVYLQDEELALIRQFRQTQGAARMNDQQQMPKQRRQYQNFLASTYSDGSFENFINLLETADTKGLNPNNRFFGQAASTMAAFAAGISLTADISVSGFDTHSNHDTRHATAMTNLTSTVDLLWYMAAQYNIADRLIVVIGSDFGRTNRYNNGDGKDHWSITSSIIMANNPPWGNRVVGSTDGAHFASNINFTNLQQDNAGGTTIEPKHVMAAMRSYLNIDSQPASLKFDLSAPSVPDFFNPALMT